MDNYSERVVTFDVFTIAMSSLLAFTIATDRLKALLIDVFAVVKQIQPI